MTGPKPIEIITPPNALKQKIGGPLPALDQQAIARAEAALAKPGDGYITPTDPETLLLGRLNTVYKKSAKPITPAAAAPVGFVVR